MLFNHADTDKRTQQAEKQRSSVYQALLYTVLQKPRDREQGGVVIALSSSNPGEGVTYVSRSLLHELAKCELTSVAGVNVSFLRKLHEPTVDAIRNSIQKPSPRRQSEDGDERTSRRGLARPERKGPWEGSWQYRSDCIDLLRAEFDYTIIDCPSIRESGDVLSIAPFVDGVILVVEANRTRRSQPHQSEQLICAAGGKLLGYILNKQTTVAPRWLHPNA